MGYFTTACKSAKIIPVPKPGKPPFDFGSHRPIGLLRNLSKLLERVVAYRLNSFIHQNHILPPGQFGFRHQHSTVSHLTRIADFIAHRKNTGMVLLDIEKACYTVWLNGLLFKILSFHLPDYLLPKVLLGRPCLSVHLNDSTSTPKPIPPVFLRCCNINYIIFPFPGCHAAASVYQSCLIRRRHCPSVSILAAWLYIPQTHSRGNDLTQLLHYMDTPIK